jgi:ATP-dependent DNA ligase
MLRPMLASAMVEPVTGAAFDARFRDGWALEEKLDGHRIGVRVAGQEVAAVSRPRSSSAPGKTRVLPPAMIAALRALGDGDYDGELVNPTGGKSWDVVRTDAPLVFVVFDIVSCNDTLTTNISYELRRALLLERLRKLPRKQQSVSTVLSDEPTWANVQAIWQRGGEGAILKRVASHYQPGARSPDWVKVKQLRAATLTIIGFEAGESGPHSALQLRDADGHITTVKTLGHAMLREVTAAPASFLGRAVVINYQEKTPTGHYRHGRFDHFAGPGEVAMLKGQR